MTHEADLAVEVGYRFEARKDALRQTQDLGVKVTFTIHPQDMPPELYLDQMGQRYLIVAVPLADDETPRIPVPKAPKAKRGKRTWDEMPYAEQAGTLCFDSQFQDFLQRTCSVTWRNALTNADGVLAKAAAIIVRARCGVESRSDILPLTPASVKFEALVREFRDSQESERFEQMFQNGPQ